MPELIKDGQVVNDPWQGELLTLQVLNDRAVLGEDSGQETGPVGVILEPDQPPSSIEGDMARLELVAKHRGRYNEYQRELMRRRRVCSRGVPT